MLQELPVFTRAARSAFRGDVVGAVVALTLGLGAWQVAMAGAPAVVSTGFSTFFANDVGWNGAKPGIAS
ncbi:hypothetical protein [Streptomyces sp. NPDC047108]|uniref:hypothetical protein n=1 Tax=Streptomyces sp. NPDC047108 TaxID=3155025 RepID=UPI0033DA68B0